MRQAVFILTTTAIIIIIINTGAVLSKLEKNPAYKLDMAADSVDDQFIGCAEETYKLIKDKVLDEELNKNKDFKNIWNKYLNIEDDFIRIIKVYTSSVEEELYSKFNDAVSSGKNEYPQTFKYTAFHFLLTRAVQIHKVPSCFNVFRRTAVSFEAKINDVIRFGRFASTSFRKDLDFFGNKSCFEINTCFGADISTISVLPDEEEVLVPPYEMFTITKITLKTNHMNCEVLYTLKSAGNFSCMNCELLKHPPTTTILLPTLPQHRNME
ncbi:erythroblast NAD(P)(+)--arginine ADP-ribosyltransferase-like [Tachysurus fulvidraco]|uniref:erythroblast NAD(P)(+)--arginine ADP-ribosyltransferase-like n=1 Tax=Tachysurus fulvidraco TaxID=1234273 RepID=UPI000F4D65ED|nr:erythroblast NAD(P)(+)--arginine ADP-ribosyltransferase-like [Tachysurus fulvidraco]